MNFQDEIANDNATNNAINSTLIIAAPTISAEYLVKQIVAFTQYQQLNNIHTGPRLSSKGIFQLFSNIAFPKALSTELRKGLEKYGLQGATNGNIPFFKITDAEIALVYFAKFDDASYQVPKLDIDTIEPQYKEMYQTLYSKDNEEKNSSIWKNKMTELGLSEVQINTDGSNISIVGEAIEDLDDLIIDFPPITDVLPHNVYLINYKGSPRIYVENRCALKLALQNLSLMSVDIEPFFYQPFDGGIWTQEELDNNKENIQDAPDCENIHKESFFTADSDDRWFEIQTVKAYIHSLRTGVYQKYSNIIELNGRDFFIMRLYLEEAPEQTEDDIENVLISIFSYLDSINDREILEFMRDDLKAHTPTSFETFINENIDKVLLDI